MVNPESIQRFLPQQIIVHQAYNIQAMEQTGASTKTL